MRRAAILFALISAAPLLAAAEETSSVFDGREYLVGDFSAADIMLGHACFMSNRLGCVTDEKSNLKAYIGRIEARPAFQTAIQMQ